MRWPCSTHTFLREAPVRPQPRLRYPSGRAAVTFPPETLRDLSLQASRARFAPPLPPHGGAGPAAGTAGRTQPPSVAKMPCPWHQDGGRPCTHKATSLSSLASQPRAQLWFLEGAGPRLWVQASATLLTLEELCQLTLAEDIGKHTCGYKWEHSHPFLFFFT